MVGSNKVRIRTHIKGKHRGQRYPLASHRRYIDRWGHEHPVPDLGNIPVRVVDEWSTDDPDITFRQSMINSLDLSLIEIMIIGDHRYPPSQNLYHFTDHITEIIESNRLNASKHIGTLSLTANPCLGVISPETIQKTYRIELDYDKLRRDYPDLVPVHYSWTGDLPSELRGYYSGRGYDINDHRVLNRIINSKKHFSRESEWMVMRPIRNLHKYIVSVEVKNRT